MGRMASTSPPHHGGGWDGDLLKGGTAGQVRGFRGRVDFGREWLSFERRKKATGWVWGVSQKATLSLREELQLVGKPSNFSWKGVAQV